MTVGCIAAGIVDEDVDPAPFVERLLYHSLDVSLAGDIGFHVQRLDTECFDLARGLGEGRFPARAQCDVRPLARELQARRDSLELTDPETLRVLESLGY